MDSILKLRANIHLHFATIQRKGGQEPQLQGPLLQELKPQLCEPQLQNTQL